MDKIIKWLDGRKDSFTRISADYGVSIPTLYKIAANKHNKLQSRVKSAIELAYKERNKK